MSCDSVLPFNTVQPHEDHGDSDIDGVVTSRDWRSATFTQMLHKHNHETSQFICIHLFILNIADMGLKPNLLSGLAQPSVE